MRMFAGTLLVGLSLALAGCDNDGDNAEAALRIIHGSPDAPPVNAKLNGSVAIPNIDYAQSTGYANVDAGVYDIAVEGIIPGGNADVITVPGVSLSQDSRTTVVAVNKVASIEPLVVADSAAIPGADEVALAVLHASTAADAATGADGVDVYVTAFGADLNTSTPAFNFIYKQTVDAGALPAGKVQIRATIGGTTTVVFDSGEVDLAPFAGQWLLAVALDTVTPTTTDASLVKLLVATDSAQVSLYDTSTNAGARVAHASPDADGVAAGPVEVWATSAALNMGMPVELIPAFVYRDLVPATGNEHVAVPGGDYVFDVAADGGGVGGAVYTSPSIALAAGSEYSVIAAGRVGGGPDFGLLLSEDNSRSVVTQASVKVVHAVPDAVVDVYVTPADQFTKEQTEMGMAGDPLLDDFTFSTITDYVAVAPGPYDIRVVAGGTAVINLEGVDLAAGSVTTAIAVGPSEITTTFTDFTLLLFSN